MAVSRDQIIDDLKDIAVKVYKVDPSEVTMETNWDKDFGSKSLQITKLAALVKMKFGVAFTLGDLAACPTFESLVDLLQQRLSE